MTNLIAQKRVIPELIQEEFTASNIVKELTPLLPDGPPRQSMMKELAELRGVLQAQRTPDSVGSTAGGAGAAIGRVAEVTLELLGPAAPQSA
jgi:lipid-A-disaccharide synthase